MAIESVPSNVLEFRRRKPFADWDEMPPYWDSVVSSYYDMRIEDGVSHEEAFAEIDAWAKAKAAAPVRKRGESDLEYLRRRAIAELEAAEASERAVEKVRRARRARRGG